MSFGRCAKLAFYKTSRALGLFRLARRRRRDRLCILCYHGFSSADEHRFRPGLFMTPKTFERRLDYLVANGFQVLELGDAVARLRAGTLPSDAVAITIDDGFHGVHRHALPRLRERALPATLYVTSYYFEKRTPIFRLVVAYMFWKTTRGRLDVAGLEIEQLAAEAPFTPRSEAAERVADVVREYGETELDEAGRVDLCRRLGAVLDVDYEAIAQERLLGLVDNDELRELEDGGVRIELHTHRHRFPTDDEARREIDDNRAVLEPIIGRRMRHFCYPSGEWSDAHFKWLEAAGVETATICEPFLVKADTPPFALGRILDDSRVAMVEFEAEVNGFGEVVRAVKRRLRGIARS